MARKIYHRVLLLIPVIFLLLVGYSCSTKKNSFTRRVYHNLTGHYNMFWNGRESYREGVKQLERSAQDNYNKILPVYNYGTEAEAQSLFPYMDKAIEKASINIQRHSMFFNKKEYVNWIDDSYMLIGYGYFYKQEYNKARRTFEFIMNEYKYNDIKYEAMLWLGNSYIRLEKYKRAQSVLDNLRNEIDKNPKISNKVQKMLPLVRADLYILQEKYPQAKEQLLDAIYLLQKKGIDARARFILGQIYQDEGELYSASEYYKQVIKKNPPYEMAFNAAINLAQSYDSRFGDNSKSIERNLLKMLKEDKNKDFRDQIYYALADVAFKNNNDTLAINNLRLSVATSVRNDYQKAASAMKVGEIYFLEKQYLLSQAYYDTALQVLPEEYPDYDRIKASALYLNELVENLIVVQHEDSLQKIASLSEEERNKIIDKIIEEVIEEEQRLKEMEELLALNAEMGKNAGMPGTNNLGGPAGSGKWYFYNPSAMGFGLSEFKKKWGTRKLEDNWRLSDKQTTFQPDVEDLIAVDDSLTSDSTIVIVKDPHTRKYYSQNLPFTEEELAGSNLKVEEALYNLGYIYKDKFDDYPRSIESFELLLERFPENEHLLQVYYQLFRIYSYQENLDQAEVYKNLIIEKFPDSDYAKLLLDPDYYKELEAQRNQAVTLYNETYEHYENGRFYTVYSNSTRALSEFEGPEETLAKFEYLRALSLGKIEVVDSLQTALENLVIKYPNSEVVPLAQNILDYLKDPSDTASVQEPEEEQFDVSMYTFNTDSKQIFSMIVSDKGVNINALKIRISDFNSKFYSLENLSITSILLNTTTHFIMVGNFNTLDKSMQYYNAILANEYVFANLDKNDFESFVIAQENYPVFYKDKDVPTYLSFFKKHYFGPQ